VSSGTLAVLDHPAAAEPRPEAACDLALFHRTLAELCRAEVPLPRALRLAADETGSRLRHDAEAAAREVERGAPLGEAYARARLPAFYGALVEAGVAAGDLPRILEEIARHAEARASVTHRVRAALAYPMLAGGFVVVLGLALVFLLPSLVYTSRADWLAGYPKVELPPAPMVVLLASGIAVLAVLVVAACVWLRRPIDGAGPGELRFRLPLVGRLHTWAVKSSFASTLAVLVRRHLPLERALRLVAAATDDRAVRRRIEAMAEHAAQGGSLAASVAAGGLVAPALLWLLEAAEASGSSADALDDLARIYRARLDRAADRLTVLAAPCIELVVGLVVLAFALCFLLPGMRFLKDVFGMG
jgi:type II secretory pathway component PulF